MADRKNAGKAPLSYIPFEGVEDAAKVFEFGATKYSVTNWCTPPYFTKDKVLESLGRHWIGLMSGQEIDPESGLPHHAHLLCNGLMYAYYERYNLWDQSGVIQQRAEVHPLLRDQVPDGPQEITMPVPELQRVVTEINEEANSITISTVPAEEGRVEIKVPSENEKNLFALWRERAKQQAEQRRDTSVNIPYDIVPLDKRHSWLDHMSDVIKGEHLEEEAG